MVETEQVPLYSKLSFDLIEYITTHGQVHQKMLSEREICKEYGVSRTTVRTALKELETLGYIYKRHGKGTFISSQWKKRQNLLEGYSFTEQMKELGRTPSTIITAFHYYKADSYIAQQLGIETGEYIYRLKRIRFADGIPMMKETTFLPARLFSDLTQEQLQNRSLYEVFSDDFQQKIIYADEEFSASILTKDEAPILETPMHAACLRLKRTSVNSENHIIEFTLSVARSDQFFYKVRYHRNTHK